MHAYLNDMKKESIW